MFLLQQIEKTKKQQLAIGAYCVKFGLTKAKCTLMQRMATMSFLKK